MAKSKLKRRTATGYYWSSKDWNGSYPVGFTFQPAPRFMKIRIFLFNLFWFLSH